MRLQRLVACTVLLLFGQSVWAAFKPHTLIADGMVLQRDMKAPVWGTADDGEEVTVQFQDQKVTATARDGKWTAYLENLKSGGPFEMTITGSKPSAFPKNQITFKNVFVGDVWICSGQSNMEQALYSTENATQAIAESKNPNVRLFTVAKIPAGTPQHNVSVIPSFPQNAQGRWLECGPQTTPNFSAVAYFLGRDLERSLKVPIGLIHTSWGGTPAEAWTSQAALEGESGVKHYAERVSNEMQAYARSLEEYVHRIEQNKDALIQNAAKGHAFPNPPASPALKHGFPCALYNGMIAPLIPYGIRGAIWYQGESNANRAHEYRTLLPTMIKNWRADWRQGDFPFLIVQLAPFMKIEKEPAESQWAELREAQLLTALNVPRTAIAVITDVGDEKDIHPSKKEPVGARLALAARAIANGEDIEYSGPIFSDLKVEGSKAHLRFKHRGGGLMAKEPLTEVTGPGGKLETRGGGLAAKGHLTGFTIAGEDHKFVNAEAEIQDDTVVVWSDKVAHPVAVRYGWANYPTGNLWNRAGLPASPFRTDDFPMLTAPKKAAPTAKATSD